MLAATYFLPLWVISLHAPQYPEGLGMEIWINKMTGDLSKINNLNHYIGMKKIHPDSIPELKLMPWIMRGMMILGIAIALWGRRRWLWVWIAMFLALSIAGLIDYYKWGYDYGHNLDMEHAIIKIPGMTYQPPLIGKKQLLNFTAISLPGLGGWVAIISLITWIAVALLEQRRSKYKKLKAVAAMLMGLLLVMPGCGIKNPAPINFGQEECAYCKMYISDSKFGSAMMTSKGKQFNFDSIECLAAFCLTAGPSINDKSSFWVSIADNPGHLQPIMAATIIHSPEIKSPMGVGLIAYSNDYLKSNPTVADIGRVVDLEQMKGIVKKAWLE